MLAVGGTVKLLSLGAGITGLALGPGGPADLLTVWSVLPSSVIGGSLIVTGAWMRGRHDAWYGPDALARVRTTKTIGWSLIGSGATLLAGSSLAIALWPLGTMYDDGSAVLYPKAYITVGVVYLIAPLLIGAGSGAVTWSASYSRSRAHKLQVQVQPTVGGLSLRF